VADQTRSSRVVSVEQPWRQITDNLTLGAELFHQTAFTTGEPGSAGFPLGSKATTGFNLGGKYDFSENYHLLFSAGHGVQNAATSNQFSYYLGIQWTFCVNTTGAWIEPITAGNRRL
jgi:hypothetical protein